MTATGYTAERAAPHERAVALVLTELQARGYECVEEPVDGHRPDIRFRDSYPGSHRGKIDYLDVKTGTPNLAVEIDSLQTYWHIEIVEQRRVYIVHDPADLPKWWRVHTPDSLRVSHGPRRRSGNGSLDDWYLCDATGSAFDDFFPEITTQHSMF